jgi:hypothetical protein
MSVTLMVSNYSVNVNDLHIPFFFYFDPRSDYSRLISEKLMIKITFNRKDVSMNMFFNISLDTRSHF